MKKKSSRRRIDVNVDELDRIIDAAMRGPLNEADGRILRVAVHAMAESLAGQRNTEKTSAVLEPKTPPAAADTPPEAEKPSRAGHGRNGADAFTGAAKIAVAHSTLHSRDSCPACGEGKVYCQKEPAPLIRIIGQAPLKATVFERERLRCNAGGGGRGKVRRHSGGDDRAAEVRDGNAIPSYGAAGSATGNAAAGGHPMGVVGAGGPGDQTGAERVDPAGGAGRGDAQRRHEHADSETGAQYR